ncbi:MAG: hypothetical protein ACR2M1_17240 [Gemmatimonadaceae bacterium]
MATREEIAIADQALAALTNCQRDLRRNAQSYLDEIAAGHPRLTTAQLAAIVNADGAAVSRLMVMIATYVSAGTRQTKLINGLAFYGLTLAQANTDRNALKSTADTQAAAALVTDADITAAANATLGSTTAVDLLF